MLASYFYFGIPVSVLDWDQVALLVGMIKGPSYYDPRRHPQRAKERRDLVLRLMKDAGHLSEQEYLFYAKKKLGVTKATALSSFKVPGYIDLVKEELKQALGTNYLSKPNLVIFTSLDPQAQLAASNAVKNTIPTLEKTYRQKNLQAAMVVSNWRTNELLAVVGSSDPSFPGLNRVTQARRQIGSLIKPIAYMTSFEKGWHLGSIVPDTPVKIQQPNGKIWEPKNFDNKFLGNIFLYKAFANSRNVPMVRVGMNTGVDDIARNLHHMGYHNTFKPLPSMLLGSVEMTPYEVNQVYATLAREGEYKSLSAIRVVKSGNEVIYDPNALLSISNENTQVVDPRNAYLAIYGMTIVTQEGTARSLRQNKRVGKALLAGKTGTSNDSRDSWFSGFDNNELVTVWIGHDDNSPSKLTGSTGALKVYDKFVSERGVTSLVLAQPEGIGWENFSKEGFAMDGHSCTNVRDYVRLPVRTDRLMDDQIRVCKSSFENAYDSTVDFVKNLFN